MSNVAILLPKATVRESELAEHGHLSESHSCLIGARQSQKTQGCLIFIKDPGMN